MHSGHGGSVHFVSVLGAEADPFLVQLPEHVSRLGFEEGADHVAAGLGAPEVKVG